MSTAPLCPVVMSGMTTMRCRLRNLRIRRCRLRRSLPNARRSSSWRSTAFQPSPTQKSSCRWNLDWSARPWPSGPSVFQRFQSPFQGHRRRIDSPVTNHRLSGTCLQHPSAYACTLAGRLFRRPTVADVAHEASSVRTSRGKQNLLCSRSMSLPRGGSSGQEAHMTWPRRRGWC